MVKKTTIIAIFFLSFLQLIFGQEPGDVLWHVDFGGSGNEAFTGVKQTPDGGYIAVGYTDSYGTGGNVKHLYAVKTDVDGLEEWTTVLGEGLSYGDWGNRVVVTDTGEYVIVGETYSYATAEKDIWLVKLDTNGDLLWSQTWDGGSYDTGSDIIINNAGEFIVTGYSFDTGGNRDALLMAFDQSGNYLWHNVYGGSDEEWTTSLCQTSDNGYVLSGYSKSYGAGDRDLYLLKTDSNGVEQWFQTHGDSSDQWGRKILVLDNGEYVIAGWKGTFITSSDIWILRTSDDGNILWEETYDYGAFDTANNIITTNDGGFLITGVANELFLAKKIAYDGTVEWMESSFDGAAVGSIQDADEDYVIVGSHEPQLFVVDATIIKLKGKDTIGVEDFVSNSNTFNVTLFPNPIYDETTLSFTINKTSTVSIEIMDLQGKLVKELVNKGFSSGTHQLQWDRTNDMGSVVSCGIYLYRVKSNDYTQSGKMIVQ